MKRCFICGKEKMAETGGYYLKCSYCGHEISSSRPKNLFIINDLLDLGRIKKRGLLDRFKSRVTRDCGADKSLIIDFGSASGRYLFHNKHLFNDHAGIEITKECIEFSRKKLALNIIKRISDLKKKKKNISLMTFWHSMEHLPSKSIGTILTAIEMNSKKNTILLISVPNNSSFMYKLFKEGFPYLDVNSHYHQFSARSLDLMMNKFGCKKAKNYFSFSYTFFGYLQGLLNQFNKTHNFMYYHKKRGVNNKNRTQTQMLLLYNYLLSAIFTIPSTVLSIYDYIDKPNGGVITVSYVKA